jgi:hypothetical protein
MVLLGTILLCNLVLASFSCTEIQQWELCEGNKNNWQLGPVSTCLFLELLRGHLGMFFLWPKAPQFGHLYLPWIIFLSFSMPLSAGFFPLPPSRHPFIQFFLCRPTCLLANGDHTSDAMGTLGQELRFSSGSIILAYHFLNLATEK